MIHLGRTIQLIRAARERWATDEAARQQAAAPQKNPPSHPRHCGEGDLDGVGIATPDEWGHAGTGTT